MNGFEITEETALWITVNAILLTAFFMLLARFLRRVRSGVRSEKERPPQLSFVKVFDDLLREVGASEAIVRTFNLVLEEVSSIKGVKVSESLTARELVVRLSPMLSEVARLKLAQLYKIYEPVRFGGRAPDEGKVEEFREALNRLERALIFRGFGY